MFGWMARKFQRGTVSAVGPPEPAAITCFISHAYQDAEVLARLRPHLPKHMTPVIFPPITVAPTEFVSDALLEAIRGADVLVYLTGGQSSSSSWVNFERRYAARLGKRVFALDPATGELTRDNAKPHNQVVALMGKYQGEDTYRVLRITDWLRLNRSVDTFDIDLWKGRWGDFLETQWARDEGDMRAAITDFGQTGQAADVCDTMRNFVRACHFGGTVVLFLSNDVCARPWPSADVFLDAVKKISPARARDVTIQMAWIEPPDIDRIRAGFATAGERVDNNLLRHMILESAQAKARGRLEFVLQRDGDFDANQIDNLLVRLEYVAFVKATQPRDTEVEHQTTALRRERARRQRQREQQMGQKPFGKTFLPPDEM